MANTEAQWNEQAFLIDFFDEWLYLQKNVKYENFTSLIGKNTGLINSILAENSSFETDIFTNFTSAQQSALVPTIRIFKVVYDVSFDENSNQVIYENPKNIEFKFQDKTSLESITKDNKKRGMDVGIKSFSWQDLGTNPADTGFAFKSELKLFFQSVGSIFAIRTSKENGSVKFADLFLPPGTNLGGEDIRDSDNKNAYRDQNFQIKMIVGWSVPNDPDGVLFTPNQLRSISKQRLSLMLTLEDHNIEFKQNGNVEVTLNHIAAIEGRMLSSDTDLLYVETGEREQIIKLKELDKTLEGIKKEKEKTQAEKNRLDKEDVSGILNNEPTTLVRAGKQELANIIADRNSLGITGGFNRADLSKLTKDQQNFIQEARAIYDPKKPGSLSQQLAKAGKEVPEGFYTALGRARLKDKHGQSARDEAEKKGAKLEVINSKAEKIQNEIEAINFDLRSKAYSRLMRVIAEKQRVFTMTVDYEDVDDWVDSLYRFSEEHDIKAREKKLAENRFTKKSKIRERFKYSRGPISDISGGNEEFANWNKKYIKADNDERQKLIKGLSGIKEEGNWFSSFFGQTATAKLGSKSVQDGVEDIKFIFFGDIIEAAIDILKNKDAIPDEKNASVVYKSSLISELKLLLGGVPLYHYDEQKKVVRSVVPLANIPISLKTFNQWFIKKIVKPLRNNYFLRDFLRDIASEMIDNAIQPFLFGPIGSLTHSTMSFTTFSLPKSVKGFKPGKAVRGTDFGKNILPSYDKDFGKTLLENYFVMYYGSSTDRNMIGSKVKTIGDPEGDTARGIIHFRFGANRGIVKNINFSKQDIPKAREARILKSQTIASRNILFSNKYDCSVTLFGTPIFKPGMLAYVDPNSLGIPSQENIAKNLGIGGYYTITAVDSYADSAKYETNLSMVFESPARGSGDVDDVVDQDISYEIGSFTIGGE